MWRFAVAVTLLACGSPAAPPRAPTLPAPPGDSPHIELKEAPARHATAPPPPPREPAPSRSNLPRTRSIDTDKAAIEGIVVCTNDHTLAPGATVVASDAAIAATQTAITDDHGAYFMELEPGEYTVSFYFGELNVDVRGVTARAHEATRVDASIRCD